MTAGEIVVTRLLAVSAVTALVSTRVYNVRLPQAPTLPAIRVQAISGSEDVHLRGGVNHLRQRVQVDMVGSSSSFVTLAAIDAAVMGDRAGSALAFFRGNLGTSPSDVTVDVITPETAPMPMVDPLEPNQLRFSRDFMVSYRMS